MDMKHTNSTVIFKLRVYRTKSYNLPKCRPPFPQFSVSYCIRKPYGASIKVSCRRLISRYLSMMPGCLKTQFVGSILTHKGLRGGGIGSRGYDLSKAREVQVGGGKGGQ